MKKLFVIAALLGSISAQPPDFSKMSKEQRDKTLSDMDKGIMPVQQTSELDKQITAAYTPISEAQNAIYAINNSTFKIIGALQVANDAAQKFIGVTSKAIYDANKVIEKALEDAFDGVWAIGPAHQTARKAINDASDDIEIIFKPLQFGSNPTQALSDANKAALQAAIRDANNAVKAFQRDANDDIQKIQTALRDANNASQVIKDGYAAQNVTKENRDAFDVLQRAIRDAIDVTQAARDAIGAPADFATILADDAGQEGLDKINEAIMEYLQGRGYSGQDFEGADFYKMTHADFATILEDVAPAGDVATAPAGETKEEKVKRLAKEYADKAKKAGQEAKDKLNEASGGKAMYIIGGVAVVVLGGIAYYCFSKKEEEGGEDDRFSSLI